MEIINFRNCVAWIDNSDNMLHLKGKDERLIELFEEYNSLYLNNVEIVYHPIHDIFTEKIVRKCNCFFSAITDSEFNIIISQELSKKIFENIKKDNKIVFSDGYAFNFVFESEQ